MKTRRQPASAQAAALAPDADRLRRWMQADNFRSGWSIADVARTWRVTTLEVEIAVRACLTVVVR